jgi:hypothetical protein
MSMDKIRNTVEMLASFYEDEGLVREAYNLDVMLNTFEDRAHKTALAQQPEVKTLEGYIKELMRMLKVVVINVENNVDKLGRNSEEDHKKIESRFKLNHLKFKKGLNQLQSNTAEAQRLTESIFKYIGDLKKDKNG